MGKAIKSAGLVLALVSIATALSPVELGTAGNYVILAQSAITTTGATVIEGDVAVSPGAATTMTGFALTLSSDGTKSSSSTVSGGIYAASYKVPTPATLTSAIADMTKAYTDAAGRTNPDFVELSGGNLIDANLKPGLYKFTTALNFGGKVTLTGSSSDVFIFQTSGALNFHAASMIVLAEGAQSKNVFYASAGAVTLGATSVVKGIILGKTTIVFGSGASLDTGRAFAQTAVTMIANKVTKP